jgi:hypothetical protein
MPVRLDAKIRRELYAKRERRLFIERAFEHNELRSGHRGHVLPLELVGLYHLVVLGLGPGGCSKK